MTTIPSKARFSTRTARNTNRRNPLRRLNPQRLTRRPLPNRKCRSLNSSKNRNPKTLRTFPNKKRKKSPMIRLRTRNYPQKNNGRSSKKSPQTTLKALPFNRKALRSISAICRYKTNTPIISSHSNAASFMKY